MKCQNCKSAAQPVTARMKDKDGNPCGSEALDLCESCQAAFSASAAERDVTVEFHPRGVGFGA